MRSERAAKCFHDILAAIQLLADWADEGGGPEQAMSDTKTRSAIERQLLVISEAAIRLDRLESGSAERLAPSIDWQGIRGMGNVIRHRYDDMDFDVVSAVLRDRLEPLRNACEQAMQALAPPP